MGIKRLASTLGLSIATVSRALNDHPEVSVQTRERVKAAAKAIAYSPNQSGRSLRKGRHNTVGLMLPPKGSPQHHNWDPFHTLAEGIQARIATEDLELVLFQSSDPADELSRLKRVVERRLVDGIILAGTLRHDPRLDYISEQDFPFVTWGRSLSGGEHSWVDFDFEVGIAQEIGQLIANGHRRIALVTPNNDAMEGHLMRQGYRAAMRRHKVSVQKEYLGRDEVSERGGHREMTRLLALDASPTAVIFQSDCMAVGAYGCMQSLGRKPGADVAIFGGVLTGELAQYLTPTLSGFSVNLRPLGECLAEALLGHMAGQTENLTGTNAHQLWPLDILHGESDGTAPA